MALSRLWRVKLTVQFRQAFNHAFAANAGDPRQEATTRRIAWVAVKRGYVKVDGEWIARP
jgi:cation transport regulator